MNSRKGNDGVGQDLEIFKGRKKVLQFCRIKQG